MIGIIHSDGEKLDIQIDFMKKDADALCHALECVITMIRENKEMNLAEDQRRTAQMRVIL